ncbi:MAG TPA: hypothetical protein VKI65_13910 [Gemmataceae bacterium]|nr:hypothetical protein [Gemmataceae bacterium]
MSLPDWQKNGWLTAHQTSPREVADLLGVVDRDLADCQTPGLSADWRLNIAYNAALQAATAALAAAGYRATRDQHHYRVIQSLVLTLGADRGLINQFEQFRKKRNIGGYERVGAVSDHEADEMTALAQELRQSVARWLGANHAELLKEARPAPRPERRKRRRS